MCFPCRLDGQNRAIFLLFVGILFANCLSLSAHEPGLDQDDPEYAAILSTLENYIEGSTRGKPQLLKQAFHADLNLYSIRNEKLSIWPGTEYIASTKPGVSTDEIGKVLFVDYEHDCAMAKVEILPASGPAFVDYFMLLKLEGGWQIVHKMYTRRNGRAGQKKLGQNKDLQKDASDPSTKPSAKKSHQEKQEPESLPMAKVQRINEILSQYDQPKTPGVAVGVVHQGKIVYQDSFGAANVEHATPIDPAKTLFNVGSVSKHFTGFAIAVLAEQKKLSLDDRVRKYVPELPEYCDTITIRHLANHSSGLRTSLSLLAMAGWAPGDVIRKHHILRILQRQHKLNFQPGEESSYCNSGYTLLAEIVERVSGKSFHQFCREEILEPTEMRQSGFSTGQTKFRPAMAYAYSRDSLGVFPRLPNDEYSGSTGLWTTCKDFTKWAMNVQSQRFGSEGLWRAMLTPGQLNDQTSTNYSLGLFTEEYRGLKFIHHGGATSGYVAFLGHFPENQLTIALLSNTSATNARELSLKIADVFLNATPKKPAEVTSTKPMKAVATREAMQRFVGRYWDEVDRTIEISILDGTLHYLIDGGPRIPLKAIGDAEFEMVGISGPNQLRFEKDSGGYAICIPNFKGTEGMRRLRPYEPLEMTDERLKEYVGRYYSDELDCFYTFRIEEGNLVVEHIRFNAIMLHPVVPDVFRNESWRFTTMHFERDSSGEVLGFKVHSMRNRNVSFTRIAPEAFVCGQKQSEYKDSLK
ncbi:MAG: serine hydrolase [Planctomycetota bacterium]